MSERGRGQPEYQPSDKDRGAVQAMAAAGYKQTDIADYLEIDDKTLRKHFRRELDFAAMEVVGFAVGKLVEAVKKGEAWAICFLLKTKGKGLGFTERSEVTGANGAPLGAPPDLSKLTDEELAAYLAINKKLAAGGGGGSGGTGTPATPD